MKSVEYTPYEYKGETILLNRFLVVKEQRMDEGEYDRFDQQLCEEVTSIITESAMDHSLFEQYSELSPDFLTSFTDEKRFTNHLIYFYTEVHSKEEEEIMISLITPKNMKVWLNETCVVINYSTWEQYLFSGVLKPGKNRFVVEMYSPDINAKMALQIKNKSFELSDDLRGISATNGFMKLDPLLLICDDYFQDAGTVFRFMYMKNGISGKGAIFKIEIADSDGAIITSCEGRFTEIVEIDLVDIRKRVDSECFHIAVTCDFTSSEGVSCFKSFIIILKDFRDGILGLEQKFADFSMQHSDLYRNMVLFHIEERKFHETNNDLYSMYLSLMKNKQLYDGMIRDGFDEEYYKKPGIHDIFIESSLDERVIKVRVNVPYDYDEYKSYPAIFCIVSDYHLFISEKIDQGELDEPVLLIDVLARGFNGGSYVGEASTIEICQWSRNEYHLDEDRIFMIGQSSSGYATWSFSKNYPFILAGMFPLTGLPCFEEIDNVSNIPTIAFVSKEDFIFRGSEDKIKERLDQYGNYEQYDIEQMTHMHLSYYCINTKVINRMIRNKRDRYPRNFYFTTFSNRHLRSYWVKIHSIADHCEKARIEVNAADSGHIVIFSRGATGLTVNLPEYINKERFIITVNQKSFPFTNERRSRYLFSIDEESVFEISHEPRINYRKGTGLLDVFLDRMKIVVGENATEEENTLALKFSNPETNAAITKMNIFYPIFREDNLPTKIFDDNIVVIDYNGQNLFAKNFEEQLPVVCDSKGFLYLEERWDGEYCIMQVIANPYNHRLSILMIQFNSIRKMKRNILLKKVKLPYYYSGLHPYCNNEIVCYIDNKYLCASVNGQPLSKV